MTKVIRSTSLPLLSVGILLGILSQGIVSGFPHHDNEGSSSTTTNLKNPIVGINRSSKDNGFSATGEEYTTRRRYKADFDLLRLFDRSYELEMPSLRDNDLGEEDADKQTEYLLTLDPTLRSRRRKRQVGTHQQMFFGVPSTANAGHVNLFVPPLPHTSAALAVPSSASSAIILNPAFTSPSSSAVSNNNNNLLPIQFLGVAPLNKNELAIMNYYQQQFPLQIPSLQVQQGAFQGPSPDKRQRQQYENIHQNYPYPYPPTLEVDPNSQPQPGAPEPVGEELANANNDAGATTDYPSDISPSEQPEQAPGQDDAPVVPGSKFPDSPYLQQQQQQQPSNNNPAGGVVSLPAPSNLEDASVPALPPSTSGNVPSSPSGQYYVPPPQQILEITQELKRQVKEKDEENRRLQAQLEQANLQVVAYEQENAAYKEYKDQYVRAEEANVKLRERVLQLENTNQHLQEQYGQLQQVNAEQRQQINSLKDTQKELITQIENVQSQMTPLSKEVQSHRKEIEDFLIRIRKLGEENETCKKQVKLYQLKINYISEQQQKQQPAADAAASPPPPQKQSQPQPVKVVAHNDDDEQDPELMRMDAEIAALQKNADNIAAAIRDLPQPPQQPILSSPAGNVAISPVQQQQQKHEFPGEAVQMNPLKNKQEQTSGATKSDAARALPTWEKPSGF